MCRGSHQVRHDTPNMSSLLSLCASLPHLTQTLSKAELVCKANGDNAGCFSLNTLFLTQFLCLVGTSLTHCLSVCLSHNLALLFSLCTSVTYYTSRSRCKLGITHFSCIGYFLSKWSSLVADCGASGLDLTTNSLECVHLQQMLSTMPC